MIHGVDAALLLEFFHAGDRRPLTLARLVSHFLIAPADTDAIPVFEAALALPETEKEQRTRILAALAALYFTANRPHETAACLKELDDYAGQEEHVLSVFIATGEHARAADLLGKHRHTIPQATVFHAMETLIADSAFADTLAHVAYELLVGGLFSEPLLHLTLSRFDGAYAEWAALAAFLDGENIQSPAVDVRVLEAALHMHAFDEFSQAAFSRLCAEPGGEYHGLLANFVELACYEMFTNQVRPTYHTLDILQRWQTQDATLSWALAMVLTKHGVQSLGSEEIIQRSLAEMEAAGLLFPVFKEADGHATAFTEKFQPFIHRAAPGQDIWLHYRVNESPMAVLPMQYVRYGIYVAIVPVFYAETITYHFGDGTEKVIKNKRATLSTPPDDRFFRINNAIIHSEHFRHDRAEEAISGLVQGTLRVRASLL
jgi:hypothetical protein